MRTSSQKLRESVRLSYSDGAFNSFMIGVGETYLPAYALAMGIGEGKVGLLVTVPLFIGSILQSFSGFAINRLSSYKKWIYFCAILQSLCFLPLIFAAWFDFAKFSFLIAVFSVYWACSISTVPAWSSWMGKVVPRRFYSIFIAKRTRICQVAILLGLFFGSFLLEFGKAHNLAKASFIFLFSVAAFSRFISARIISSQSDVQPRERLRSRISFSFLKQSSPRLLCYLFIIYSAVQISGPFFSSYMLGELKLSYIEFMLLTAASFCSKAFATPVYSKIASKKGIRVIQILGGFGVVPLAILWTFSSNFYYLLFLQVLSGISWGAFEYAIFMIVFDKFQEKDRHQFMTFQHVLHAIAVIVGSSIGYHILRQAGEDQEAYFLIFSISSVLRLVSLPILLGVKPKYFSPKAVYFRILAVRPKIGGLHVPLPPKHKP